MSYTVWLRREGFPPVDVPIAISTGTYFVNNAEKVDADVAQPLSEVIAGVDGVETVTSLADNNFFQLNASLEDGVTNTQGSERIRSAVEASQVLPEGVKVNYLSIDAAKFLGEYDILVALYGPTGTDPGTLEQAAYDIAREFESIEIVAKAQAEPLFSTGFNPTTGEQETQQTSFGRFGSNQGGGFQFYESTVIGITGVGDDELDIFQLSEEVRQRIDDVSPQLPDGLSLSVAADFTSNIDTQVSSLENNVLTGLLAVTIISALMISWRVSILTALFMVSVIFVTMLLLLLVGQTLNTITLFALVLALGLFVDDATIISEAIDAAKDRQLKKAEIIKRAINSVGSASFAGTLTTVLVFVPLLFISGVLGQFIFYLPFTIILALMVSLVLSLTLIPFLSHYLVLTDKNMDRRPWLNPVPIVLANMIRRLKTKRMVGIPWALAMFGLSLAFFGLTPFYLSRLGFNIFPNSKDSNELGVFVSFDPGTTIEQAEDISDSLNQTIQTVVGDELVQVVYAGDTLPSTRGAVLRAELTPFNERDVKAPALVSKLEAELDDLDGATTQVVQLDAGPPAEEFPFRLQIFGDDVTILTAAANEISSSLNGAVVTRSNNTTARIIDTKIGSTESVVRKDGRRFVEVLAAYEDDDVSALVQATRELVEEQFNAPRLNELGLSEDALGFDFGQESENEKSFEALGPAGLAAVGVMLILLIIQFRSLLKPLLIFLAMPFSFLGVTLGLYISNNPLSFFAMVGFIGLIGIAVNNTILLVDAANQERRRGASTVEAIARATQKRFRPLFTTTATTTAALAPLAITDPFWEPLAITIMFGLLSSTILVIMSFPFYYIAIDGTAGWVINGFKRLIRHGQA